MNNGWMLRLKTASTFFCTCIPAFRSIPRLSARPILRSRTRLQSSQYGMIPGALRVLMMQGLPDPPNFFVDNGRSGKESLVEVCLPAVRNVKGDGRIEDV